MLKKSLCALFIIGLVLPSFAFAWEGKVIGLKDCRAVIVFDGTNFPVTVFLRGVNPAMNCPRGARQFVSTAVFGKKVDVKGEQKTGGGVVAEVLMEDGESLNKKLLGQAFMRNATLAEPGKTVPSLPRAKSSQPSPLPAKTISSPGERLDEPSAHSDVRRWRDKNGNIHFTGTAGGE